MLETLLASDAALFRVLNSAHTPAWDIFFRLITQLGNGWVTAPLLVAVIRFRTPRPALKRVLTAGTCILLACGLLNAALKKTIDRPRPPRYFSAAQTGFKVHVVGKPLTARSFPSGHTVTAFGAAALLAGLYGGLFNFAFLPALLAGYSRVYLGVHFPLDVLAGALLATVCTYAGIRITGIHRIARPPAAPAQET